MGSKSLDETTPYVDPEYEVHNLVSFNNPHAIGADFDRMFHDGKQCNDSSGHLTTPLPDCGFNLTQVGSPDIHTDTRHVNLSLGVPNLSSNSCVLDAPADRGLPASNVQVTATHTRSGRQVKPPGRYMQYV